MNNQQADIKPQSNKIPWLLSYLVVLVGLMFSFMSFDEFYNVRFGGQESAYPFGNINDNPWYYKSASLYTKYFFVCGSLFLGAALVTLFAAIKKNKRLLVIGICLTALFLFGNMISAATQ